MDKSHPLSSPMVVRSLEVNKDPFRPKEENEELLGPEVPYLSAIGALMYLANYVRAPPPGPLRRGVVPLTGYRGMSHALFFRLRESSNPRPKGHIEMGSTLTTN